MLGFDTIFYSIHVAQQNVFFSSTCIETHLLCMPLLCDNVSLTRCLTFSVVVQIFNDRRQTTKDDWIDDLFGVHPWLSCNYGHQMVMMMLMVEVKKAKFVKMLEGTILWWAREQVQINIEILVWKTFQESHKYLFELI